MVGRADELARLIDALERARAGQPSAMLVAGDAGVGKTRLLTELAARAGESGVRVLTGHCVDVGEVGVPYLPFTDALRALASDRPGLLAQRYPLVEQVVRGGADLDDEQTATEAPSQERLFRAMVALLAELAEAEPAVLLVEDVHWADQSTRSLLRYLLGRPDRGRLLVVLSYRPDDLHRRHPLRPLLAELVRLPGVDRLALEPMPDADVTRLVRALEPGGLGDVAVERIVARAEGNAFYAEELLEAASGGGDPGDPNLPTELADVLLTRLEQLPATAQRVVRTAAAGGRRVNHAQLRAVLALDDEEFEAALREAITRHVLVAGDAAYTFRHALLREVVYADLLPGERVRLHARFAQLIGDGADGSAAELAYHSRASNDLPAALGASLQAAADARRVGAPAEELAHLDTALALWSAVPDAAERFGRDEVSLMLGAWAAASQAGATHRAITLARAALDRIGPQADAELAARVRYTIARSLLDLDRERAAYAESGKALDLLPADPPTLTRVWALATHLRSAVFVDGLEAAQEFGDEAIRSAKLLGADAPLADVTISMAMVERRAGDVEGALARLDEALRLARASGDSAVELRALFNLAIVCHNAGDLAASLRWCEESDRVAVAQGRRDAAYPVETRQLQVQVRLASGDWDGAVRISSSPANGAEVPAIVVAAGLQVLVARGTPNLDGRLDRAVARGRDDVLLALLAGIAVMEEATWRGDLDRVRSAYAEVTGVLRKWWEPDDLADLRLAAMGLAALADHAETARLSGQDDTAARDRAEGRQLVERLRRVAEVKADELHRLGVEARAWRARGEAEWARLSGEGGAEAEIEAWTAALDGFDYGDVYEQARCRRRLAAALLAAGKREAAESQVAAAYDTARRLGARPLADALEGLARRGRLDLGPAASDRRSAGAGGPVGPADAVLTPRERDVLDLLARGQTNRQIGERLYISTKTASVHVSNILAKLGASGRTEAVTIAHRRGLLPAPSARSFDSRPA